MVNIKKLYNVLIKKYTIKAKFEGFKQHYNFQKNLILNMKQKMEIEKKKLYIEKFKIIC